MKKLLITSFMVLTCAGSLLTAETPRTVSITWYGQSCFLITTPAGTKILIDPVDIKDYKVPKELIPDVVTVSHNHFDHNAVGTVSGNPEVIYGKTREGSDQEQKFIPVDKKIKEVRIYDVVSNHFPAGGDSTLNAVFVFEFDSLRIVHLGDLGTTLSSDQIRRIGRVDILMIPVGGEYTIWGATADSVVAQLKPTRAVIPMHFKTRVADFLPYTANDFVKGKANIERISGNQYILDMDAAQSDMKYVVFESFK
ncbi:MAG: MBL fold metallo-hydrolase [candidate division Zixibacteria bacterium]|nr:MBL fold metallo-hydrolase [candidate division Zixibacteria bacterium]